MKETWSIVNDLRENPKKSNAPKIAISADEINEFYCSIARKLSSNIIVPYDPLINIEDCHTDDTFRLNDTNIDELFGVIKDLKNKNSTGYDDISIKIFQNLPREALETLVSLINHSFRNGIFPTFLKKSVVIPLHKGGNLDDPSNYRPISLIPTLAKIIEKLVKKRLNEFLSSHNIIKQSQFGFQSKKNTQDAIFSFLFELYSGINAGDVAAAVFCDLKKAFDCVDHKILLRKLHRYGCEGVTLEWFESYLTGRSQSVKSDVNSKYIDIDSGVPQGSVLGPTLFLLYINDLLSLNTSGKITLFADDTTILWHSKTVNDLNDKISRDINIIKSWCDSNLLSFNISKTNIVAFKCTIDDVPLENEFIETRECTKFLGFFIDSKLKFEAHIKQLKSKISSGCYAVRVISRELGTVTARTAYYALIESQLRYAIPFWGVCNSNLLDSVLKLQKRAIRNIFKLGPRDSCRPWFKAKMILTVVALFVLETVCLVKKHISKFESTSSHYNTRQRLRNDLKLPAPSSSLVKDSFFYNGVKMFNHLPTYAKESNDSIESFKKNVKKLLSSRPYYSLQEFYNDNF